MPGHRVAKYLNSPETALFQKRRNLYAADLARAEARKAGWVAVVEGYTDVIAAHQVGLANVVGTLGTALGDDHVAALRRLADRVVLIFDGDEAGQKAADRSLELFLGHEIDVRVLTLPDDLDPCDFLLEGGRRALPGDGRIGRSTPWNSPSDAPRTASTSTRSTAPGRRRSAVLSILARVPGTSRAGLDLKVAKALDTLSQRLGLPVSDLDPAPESAPAPPSRAGLRSAAGRTLAGARGVSTCADPAADLDPLDRELVRIALNEPAAVPSCIAAWRPTSLRDAPLRAILRPATTCRPRGMPPTFDRVALRLDDPATRSLAAGLLLPMDPAPLTEKARRRPVG